MSEYEKDEWSTMHDDNETSDGDNVMIVIAVMFLLMVLVEVFK